MSRQSSAGIHLEKTSGVRSQEQQWGDSCVGRVRPQDGFPIENVGNDEGGVGRVGRVRPSGAVTRQSEKAEGRRT